jgi:hypothetical protein
MARASNFLASSQILECENIAFVFHSDCMTCLQPFQGRKFIFSAELQIEMTRFEDRRQVKIAPTTGGFWIKSSRIFF